MAAYPFKQIEAKWQSHWDSKATFRTPAKVDTSKPKYYVLDMFPYPSGDGLHVGHPEGYTATDIVARYKRMRGFNVLHPMGWDAFGLPAEQYAIKTGTHPRITTERNIKRFREQLKTLGFSYDWSARSTRPTPATTSGRSGSSCSSSSAAWPIKRRCRSGGAPSSARCSRTRRSSTASPRSAASPACAGRCASGC